MYIHEKIYGLPKPSKPGYATSPSGKSKSYVYKVNIGKYRYYKVHLKRGNKSKIYYFKNKPQAELFVEMLHVNRYL